MGGLKGIAAWGQVTKAPCRKAAGPERKACRSCSQKLDREESFSAGVCPWSGTGRWTQRRGQLAALKGKACYFPQAPCEVCCSEHRIPAPGKTGECLGRLGNWHCTLLSYTWWLSELKGLVVSLWFQLAEQSAWVWNCKDVGFNWI